MYLPSLTGDSLCVSALSSLCIHKFINEGTVGFMSARSDSLTGFMAAAY